MSDLTCGATGSTGAEVVNAININSAKSNRNILINGEVTRVNQRGFDGTSWVDGEYAYDRWKATGSQMTQIVEDGNYKYNTEYILTGDGAPTSHYTSPSSGDWTLPSVPRTARNIQLEEGSVATPFEQVPIADTLARCQRYYEKMEMTIPSGTTEIYWFKVTKRIPIPTITSSDANWITTSNTNGNMCRFERDTGGFTSTITIDAEL